TIGHAIWKVNLSGASPVYSLYAGVPGPGRQPTGQILGGGYVNGPALSAKFNEPYSIIMAPDRTMYVADFMNCAIRKISADGSTVSTLVGLQPGQTPPSMATVAANRDTYSPPGTVPWSSNTIPYPQVIRFDSKGNIVVGEPVSTLARLVNMS